MSEKSRDLEFKSNAWSPSCRTPRREGKIRSTIQKSTASPTQQSARSQIQRLASCTSHQNQYSFPAEQ
jgi:hypothetical protein